MPSTKLGAKKMAAIDATILGRNDSPNETPSTACVTTRMLRVATLPATKISPSVRHDAKRSAMNPPKKLPPDMPASTTPMIVVQV
jgi:hypothetical protein